MPPESAIDMNPENYLPGRPLHVGEYTHAFFDAMENLFVDAGDALSFAGGNVRIEFYNGVVFTLVTSGPQTGVYYQPIDVPVHFELKCEEWFLNNLFDPTIGDDYDLKEAMIFGGVEMEGDLEVYGRLSRFKVRSSSLDVRMGAAKKTTKRPAKRRRRGI